MPYARLLNEINKFRETELQIHPSYFIVSAQPLVKTTFRLHKEIVCPTGFGATFAAVFVLIYWLREFPLSAVTNRFELRCQLKQLISLYYKVYLCCLRLLAAWFERVLLSKKNILYLLVDMQEYDRSNIAIFANFTI